MDPNRRLCVLAASCAALAWAAAAQGLSITPGFSTHPEAARDIAGHTYTVLLDPITHLDAGATAAFRALLNSEFDGRNANGTANPAVDWTFDVGADLFGAVTIDQYDAFARGAEGGAILDLDFNGVGAPTNLRWIQFVDTTLPRVPGLNPTVDLPNTSRNPAGDDNLPFYFTEGTFDRNGNGIIDGSENELANGFRWVDPLFDHPGNPNRTIQNPAPGTDLVFLDAPSRPLLSAPIDWNASVYLVEWDGVLGGTVTIHDGIGWGFSTTVAEPSTLMLLVAASLGLLAGAHGGRDRGPVPRGASLRAP